MSEVLYTIVHNNLKYEVTTDHLCSFKLWITVYDGDSIVCGVYMWLLDKEGDILDVHLSFGKKKIPSYKDASGFRWKHIDEDHPGKFSEEVKKKLDSYFKLKAFW